MHDVFLLDVIFTTSPPCVNRVFVQLCCQSADNVDKHGEALVFSDFPRPAYCKIFVAHSNIRDTFLILIEKCVNVMKTSNATLITAYCLLLLTVGTRPAPSAPGPLVADGTSVTAADGETYTAWQVSNSGLLTSGSGNTVNGTVGVASGTVSAH
ncbi:MAG: hypothetical protein LBK60_10250, partial [Verrucomicrobiales bacterium]|nr:hypothetical protein [Verrucomicrobiales bacterium]